MRGEGTRVPKMAVARYDLWTQRRQYLGTWTLERLTTHSSPMNAPYFGTNYHAVFHLKYSTSTFGSYTETPKLDWHETIMMNDYQNRQTWVFDTNMYAHNQCSQTLIVWARRYLEAYRYVAGIPYYVAKGKVELKTKDGAKVTLQDLGGAVQGDAAQADAVRSYLKRKGGKLIIEIHDIPGLNIPTAGQNKERLLMFNIGVEGLPLRSKAEQYLKVQFGVPQGNWLREFTDNGWRRSALKISGLANAAPPANVATPTPPMFMPGECW